MIKQVRWQVEILRCAQEKLFNVRTYNEISNFGLRISKDKKTESSFQSSVRKEEGQETEDGG
jgi:hypothetical protein